jgi:Protein of unknown function (DUF3591)
MVKPEEVCVIDAMQVGARHLEDAGYAAQDDEDDDDDTEGKNLEQELAPWKTSKAFLEASADKAMLQLHGDGDPSGHGLAFSFIKTSMKGGYIGALQGPSATSAAAIEAEKKANGGHTYNVRKQQGLYNDAIRDIWEKQKTNLSDPSERAENEMELEQEDEDERQNVDQTPRPFPAGNFDDSASQFSTGSRRGRAMRIVRQVKNKFGGFDEVTEIVKDPRVWREYQKRRAELDAESMKLDYLATVNTFITNAATPTGNAEHDKQEMARYTSSISFLIPHTNVSQCQDGARSSSTQQRAPPSSREAKGSSTHHRTRSRRLSLRYSSPNHREAHRHRSEMRELWTGRTYQNQQKVLPQLRLIFGPSQATVLNLLSATHASNSGSFLKFERLHVNFQYPSGIGCPSWAFIVIIAIQPLKYC